MDYPPDLPSYASEKIRGDVDELLERAGRLKNLPHRVWRVVIRTHWRLCYSAKKGGVKKRAYPNNFTWI